MSRVNQQVERRVRIEMLRARAAVERQELCFYSRQLSHAVQPDNLFSLLKGQLSQGVGSYFSSQKAGGWLELALSFSQRYPMLLSGASAVAGTVLSKKKWRLGVVALTAWRLYSAYQRLRHTNVRK